MKRLLIATTALTLLAAPLSGAFAQGRNDRHDDHRPGNAMMMEHHDNDRRADYRDNRHDNGRHRGWYKGGRIDRRDWDRGYRINDYRRHHLAAPPRGSESRPVANNYLLAAAATGLIMGVLLANP